MENLHPDSARLTLKPEKSEHPKAWVRRLVGQRGLHLPEKRLYWMSVHLERFIYFCRKTGPESSAILPSAVDQFLSSLPSDSAQEAYARDHARIALDR